MNDQAKFEDFIFEKWNTLESEHMSNGDTVYTKAFIRKGHAFCIAARFTKAGNYCNGFLVDGNGTAIVIGGGFSFDSFLSHLAKGLKSI